MKDKTILVTGGAGFIGSQVNKQLNIEGYKTIVFDNLSRGDRRTVSYGEFINGDLSNKNEIEKVLKNHRIDGIMHFAAYIDVGESTLDPEKYYINNLNNTLNLLSSMRHHDIKTFVFSSSAAVYGYPHAKYITEKHPTEPINPYGESKLMAEKMIRDFDKAYGLKSCCLRYFNAAGGDPDGEIKNYAIKENNLIPLILRSIQTPEHPITIYGTDYPTPDGTCIRDYIHVYDLATAHILALEKLFAGAPSDFYNLGNGNGFSVREVIRAAEETTNQRIKFIEGPRRPGDPPFLLADSTKAHRELGWKPLYPEINSMIRDAWKSISK